MATIKLIRTEGETTVIPSPPPTIYVPEPPPPPTPAACFSSANLLGTFPSVTLYPSYIPNSRSVISFIHASGSYYFEGVYPNLNAFKLAVYNNMLTNVAITTLFNIYNTADYLTLVSKNAGAGSNILTTTIDNIGNIYTINALFTVQNCPAVVAPINTKPTSCGTLYQDTNNFANPIKEFELTLIDPAFYGGTYFVAVDIQAYGATNKFEILHNNVKKATSSMTAGGNYTPFDNTDTEPVYPYTSGAAQFIGDSIPISVSPPYVYKPVPARVAEFTTDTGRSIPLTNGFMQRLWFKYTSADYAINKKVNVRIVGQSDYKFFRICE